MRLSVISSRPTCHFSCTTLLSDCRYYRASILCLMTLAVMCAEVTVKQLKEKIRELDEKLESAAQVRRTFHVSCVSDRPAAQVRRTFHVSCVSDRSAAQVRRTFHVSCVSDRSAAQVRRGVPSTCRVCLTDQQHRYGVAYLPRVVCV